jgi:hypothetical protein
MVSGIDEYTPVRIGIFHATLFVSILIFYVDFGVGILDWMGRRGLDCLAQ